MVTSPGFLGIVALYGIRRTFEDDYVADTTLQAWLLVSGRDRRPML